MIMNGNAPAQIAPHLPEGMERWPMRTAGELCPDEVDGALLRLAEHGGLVVHYDYIKAKRRGIRSFKDDPPIQIYLQGEDPVLINIVPTISRLVHQFHTRDRFRLAREYMRKGPAKFIFRHRIRKPVHNFLWRIGIIKKQKDVASLYAKPGFADASIARWSEFVSELRQLRPDIAMIEIEPFETNGKPDFRLRSPSQQDAPDLSTTA